MRTLLTALLAATPLLAACTQNADPTTTAADGSTDTIQVTSTDDGCELSATTAPSGTLTFAVTNGGSSVTEFYLYAADGKRILGEVENIGPQLSRELVVSAPAGRYVTACKPGMSGAGIRGDFTVTHSGTSVDPSAADAAQVDAAVEGYADYVRQEAARLLAQTREFAAAYTAGRDDRARALYPEARVPWERIEPVAESFGDLDPEMDAREADLEPGQRWTGWHRIEKDLWPPAAGYTRLTAAQRRTYAADLVANTRKLVVRVQRLELTVDQVANGSRGLLEEVATGKVTGEEEIWSHTDLWDFQANVDGAEKAYELLEPIVERKDAELADTLEQRFAALQHRLEQQRQGAGFRPYDRLSPAQVRDLAAAVDALAEPLSRLTGTVLG
jgi:iron uptake system component EfeO